MKDFSLGRAVVVAVLVVSGWICAATLSTTNVARGETRPVTPPAALLAGDQLALPILKEIAGTLHQMDARLARLETAAQKLQPPHGEINATAK